MSSTSPEWQLARQSGGRVRAASFVVISLFLVLIVLAWHLGTTPKAAHHHKTYLHYWHRVPDALDREISGLEFIRKSLEFQWLGGPPTPSHSLNKHLLHEQAVSNSRHGQHAKKCAPERISRCHADCNPKIYSLSTRQVATIMHVRHRLCACESVDTYIDAQRFFGCVLTGAEKEYRR